MNTDLFLYLRNCILRNAVELKTNNQNSQWQADKLLSVIFVQYHENRNYNNNPSLKSLAVQGDSKETSYQWRLITNMGFKTPIYFMNDQCHIQILFNNQSIHCLQVLLHWNKLVKMIAFSIL